MQLIQNGTQGSTTMPSKQTPSGTPGYANSGPPGTYAPTVFDPDLGNTLIAEIANAVQASGQSLSASNNSQLLAAIRSLPAGRLLNVQVFPTTGTYTPTAGTNSIEVEVWGGGAAGGGTLATTSSQSSAGGGGGSGAYGRGRYTSGFSGVTVTVGAGGYGVAGAAGANGGASSFGSLLTAPGGGGGQLFSSPTPPNASIGGFGAAVASGGYLNLGGVPGGDSVYVSIAGVVSGLGGGNGGGAATYYNGNGNPAVGYGAGGGGAAGGPSQSALSGGAGGNGFVVVREYS